MGASAGSSGGLLDNVLDIQLISELIQFAGIDSWAEPSSMDLDRRGGLARWTLRLCGEAATKHIVQYLFERRPSPLGEIPELLRQIIVQRQSRPHVRSVMPQREGSQLECRDEGHGVGSGFDVGFAGSIDSIRAVAPASSTGPPTICWMTPSVSMKSWVGRANTLYVRRTWPDPSKPMV